MLKISLGAFLLRLIKVPWQKWSVIFTVASLCTFSSVFFVMSIFQCTPISHFWELGSEGHCLSPTIVLGFTYTHSILVTMSDIFFIVLPIILVSRSPQVFVRGS